MNSARINQILFDYEKMSSDEIRGLCVDLPPKILRWLGSQHPDNRTRKLFFQLTNVQIGDGTVINVGFTVSDGYENLLEIGERVAISPHVSVICESGPNNSRLINNEYVKENLLVRKPVKIMNDCWLGAHAVILPGVKVGEGSIVGAGAVVSDDVSPGSVVAGVPAKVIRRL